jgi:hypothetical protein
MPDHDHVRVRDTAPVVQARGGTTHARRKPSLLSGERLANAENGVTPDKTLHRYPDSTREERE